jgi:DNA-binding transcriptional MerR regulator
MKKFMTEKEVEAEYGISVNTLRYWRQKRINLPFVKIGKKQVRYKRDDTEAFFDENMVEVMT